MIVHGFVKGGFEFWNGLGVKTDDILDADNTTDKTESSSSKSTRAEHHVLLSLFMA